MNDLIISKDNSLDSIKQYFEGITGNYRDSINGFLKWLGDRSLDFEAIKEYIQALPKMTFIRSGEVHHYKPQTINLKRQAVLTALKDFVSTADIETRIKTTVLIDTLNKQAGTKRTKINDISVGREKILTEKEFLKVQMKLKPHIGLIALFLFKTGTRISEALNIRREDIRIQKGIAYISIIGKGKKQRDIFIDRDFLNEIKSLFKGKAFLFEHNGKRFSRSYISHEIDRASKAVLGRKAGSHTMRHTFATLTIERTKKVKAVSLFLGHASTAITMDLYNHESLSPEDLGIDQGEALRA